MPKTKYRASLPMMCVMEMEATCDSYSDFIKLLEEWPRSYPKLRCCEHVMDHKPDNWKDSLVVKKEVPVENYTNVFTYIQVNGDEEEDNHVG